MEASQVTLIAVAVNPLPSSSGAFLTSTTLSVACHTNSSKAGVAPILTILLRDVYVCLTIIQSQCGDS